MTCSSSPSQTGTDFRTQDLNLALLPVYTPELSTTEDKLPSLMALKVLPNINKLKVRGHPDSPKGTTYQEVTYRWAYRSWFHTRTAKYGD